MDGENDRDVVVCLTRKTRSDLAFYLLTKDVWRHVNQEPWRKLHRAQLLLNVHAARTLHGADHAQVERICRYLARPPIAQDRLELLEDGRVR